MDRAACQHLDQADPLSGFRTRFTPPQKDTIFLDANSMGAMPVTVPDRLASFCTDQWVELRRQGWSHSEWLQRPRQIGDAIAHLMGAGDGNVLVSDNTTVNLYKILTYAWRARSSGSVVLTEDGNFPTDLYVAQGLGHAHQDKPETRVCTSRDQLVNSIGPDTAVVYLSHADYRTGECWNMADINRQAHEADALTVWDLSHSTGAIPVDLIGDDADFAVGCGYKYLSGGPGGPAYLWAHPRHAERGWPTICGWMGHRDVFAFATEYEPLAGAGRHATGTPAVIADEIFFCAAEIWKDVDQNLLWAKHQALGDLTIELLEQECGQFGVTVNTPRDYSKRGGHIGFSHPGAGPVSEALLEAGVVGSFRRPNSLRFGLGPLYLSFEDIWEAIARLRQILEDNRWQDEKYQQVSV
ncbi:MAG TPA: aminotransferase class V-fold PLP-dependent enzyme [Arenicellales bacterium]|jgi:kynureninase|nr:aminotransferase class V-fold PLP-dependent enzyme [Arenicellales bacterium]HCF75071.1 kynureninase [Gammaproteobacteria bacterium]HJP10157.1 aminotransferase class V-fold PLP-dependent enzyme [Arenicellales bacterium]|tara:strand:+ start:4847 stop:6079 length:1233 start_codon:yes stop_codon:yes gene_type:complete